MAQVTVITIRIMFGWRDIIEYAVVGPRGGSVALPSRALAGAVARYFLGQEARASSRSEREALLAEGAERRLVTVKPSPRQLSNGLFLATVEDGDDPSQPAFVGVDANGHAMTEVGLEQQVLEALEQLPGNPDGSTPGAGATVPTNS